MNFVYQDFQKDSKSAAYATGAAFSTHVDGVEEDLRSKTVGLGLWFIC